MSGNGNGPAVKILLVEDEPAVAETTSEMLKHLGHDVTTVTLPSKALDLAGHTQSGFDLVISDITMPEMNGHQLAERLHRLWPEVPVLFMTGYDSHMAESTGVPFFIPKPLSLQALKDGIQKILSDPSLARRPQ